MEFSCLVPDEGFTFSGSYCQKKTKITELKAKKWKKGIQKKNFLSPKQVGKGRIPDQVQSKS